MPDTTVVSSSGTLPCQPWSSSKLITIIGRLVGLSNDSTLRAGVLDMLNVAIQEFDLAHDWSVREQTAANITVADGDGTYSLPTDFKKIYDVRLIGANERTLFPLDRRQYDRFIRENQDTESIPSHYHLFEAFDAAQITLVPTPSAGDTLQIRYYRTFPTLTDDASDNLCIPHRYTVPIIYKAAELVTAWKSPELSEVWRLKYERALRQAIADDMTLPDDLEGFIPYVEWASDRTDYINPDDLSFYPRN